MKTPGGSPWGLHRSIFIVHGALPWASSFYGTQWSSWIPLFIGPEVPSIPLYCNPGLHGFHFLWQLQVSSWIPVFMAVQWGLHGFQFLWTTGLQWVFTGTAIITGTHEDHGGP